MDQKYAILKSDKKIRHPQSTNNSCIMNRRMKGNFSTVTPFCNQKNVDYGYKTIINNFNPKESTSMKSNIIDERSLKERNQSKQKKRFAETNKVKFIYKDVF